MKNNTKASATPSFHETTGGLYLHNAIKDKINYELHELNVLKAKIRNNGYIS
ncbi:MAG: hypothetical protein JW904_03560 [Spirochaetales bacterium]|nr:hypothetical protein [Spirochaetales bacterium]